MNKRKILCSLVSGAMIVSMLTSCNGGTDPAESSDVPAEPTETTATETPEIEGYNLLWADEFDGDTLNLDIWTREVREPGWTNNELQEYRDSEENVFVQDGCLVLKAIKTEVNGRNYYTSGKVNSQNKADFMYGKVVIRAKVPEGKGLWPAAWMMPQDEQFYGQWPKCGEIDIMENLGQDPATSYSTIHYGEPHAEQQGTITLDEGSFASDFHIYSVEWEPGEMRFYTDDTLVLTVNDWFTAVEGEDDKPYPAPFNQPFFVQMNLAVGGDWPGNPKKDQDFSNAEFLIDYVRVYQLPEYDTNVEKPPMIFKDPLEDGNYVYNGDFASDEDLADETDWQFLLFLEGEGEAHIEDGMAVISSTNDGTEEYSVQFLQADMPVLKGHTYRVTYEARADEARDMVVAVTAPNKGWSRYYPDTPVDLTTEWQTFTFEFTSDTKDDNFARLEYNLGNHGYTSTVYLRNISYVDITE